MDKQDFYREADADSPGPLAGVRVLEITTTWAGPMCGCLLADYGADVIKVEHPGGEVARYLPPYIPGTDPPVGFMHAMLNRNKRSITLDLHHPEAVEAFLQLAARADIVVENFKPGALDRFGAGYAVVRGVRPDVIFVSISGFGQWGPEHDRPGYDPLAQAESGYMSLNGPPDSDLPLKSPTFLADELAGLHGAMAAMAALHHRQHSGEGQHVDVSLLDSLVFQSSGYPALAAMGVDLPRLGNEFRIAAPANAYRARDGWVLIGVLLDSHWRELTAVLQRPELAEHPDWATAAARIGNRRAVNDLVGDWAAQRTVDEAVTALKAADLPVAPIRSYAEAAQNPHIRARDMLQTTSLDGGAEIPVVGPAAKLSRTPTRVRSGPPALGAHTDAILEELGYNAEARRHLRDRGAI